MIKAAFFDLDDTLVHTCDLNVEAYQESLRFHGFEFTDSFLKEMMRGAHWSVFLLKLLPDATPELLTSIRNRKASYYELRAHSLKPNQPLVEMLKIFAGRLKIGLVTSARRDTAISVISMLDLFQYFDVIIAAEDVINIKPSPDPYIAAAKILNVNPDECIVFEDSPIGVRSAVSFGGTVFQFINDL